MAKREQEKRASLDALAKIASRAAQAPPPPKPVAADPRAAPRPPAAPRPAPSLPRLETEADRARRRQMEERKAKLEEERMLRLRREQELARGAASTWRGQGFRDIPASVYRTGFDRAEPTLAQKVQDVLGDAREKEGRAKAREKGRRHGGR